MDEKEYEVSVKKKNTNLFCDSTDMKELEECLKNTYGEEYDNYY